MFPDILLKKFIGMFNSFDSAVVESPQERAIEHSYTFVGSAELEGIIAGASGYLLLRTPADKLITVVAPTTVSVDDQANKISHGHVELYEDAVITDIGTLTGLVSANLNRNNPLLFEGVITSGPTFSDEGTLLYRSVFSEEPSTGPLSFQLKPGTDYLVKYSNDGTVTADIHSMFTVFQLPL